MTKDDFQLAFPDCTDIAVLKVVSGQKDVAKANCNGKTVALKVFKKSGGDEDKRIERELAAMNKLKSTYVPQVFASGIKKIAGEDRYFIVEQFIEGDSLLDVLSQAGEQPIDKILFLLDGLLTACGDFAAVGVTHRDLKPANLMIDANGKLWVIDFGFCRHVDFSKATPSGVGVGTPGYYPLEQAKVIKADIDVRADLFASGVIAYEAATGAPSPWRVGAGNGYEVIQRMTVQDLPKPAIAGDKNGQLAQFIGWLVQRFPNRRPQTAEEASRAFKNVVKALQNQ